MKLEWLIVADAAQIADGKLYLLGGGWTVLTVNTGFPVVKPLAVAVAFSVPWEETNQRQKVEIEIADEDGQTLARLDGAVEVGRPPGIPHGQDQRVQVPLEALLQFPRPGTYVVMVRIDGEEVGRTTFNVIPGPGLAHRPPPGQPPSGPPWPFGTPPPGLSD